MVSYLPIPLPECLFHCLMETENNSSSTESEKYKDQTCDPEDTLKLLLDNPIRLIDFIIYLNLPTDTVELSTSRLQQWNLCELNMKITFYCKRQITGTVLF